MSQKGSSIVSGENSQLKYKKALMQIQKIHTANKVLKNQSEEMKAEYERQINELSLSLQHISKEYDIIKNDKAELEKFLEELQVSNSELRKEYNNLEREVTYLNDVLTEQNAELKKVNAFKDEKGLSTLITSYEDRELSYRKDISRLDQIIKNLKTSCETLENDLAEESRQRYKLEDLNNNLKMEISRYRELNLSLLSKNQSIVASMLNRTSEGKEKYRQAENVLGELGRQLELVKSARVQQQTVTRTTVSLASYEAVLQDKNKIEGELSRLRERIQDYESRAKQLYETEQKMKKALLRSQQLNQQCNMLKSKLIMIETKDLMQGSVAEDNQLKEFEDKVIANRGLNDPLQGIKNSGDSSHFQLMKRYVVELKQKLGRAVSERREIEKKYRSLKQKAGEKVQKAIGLQQQNKLLKGKLEGFERLTQRLQYELQISMEVHQEELNQIKSATTNVINKKTEQVKTASAFVRAQLDLELDKFEKAEKALKQEIQALRLENSTEKIKNSDLTEKLQQTTEFLNIYKNKFTAANAESTEAEENNQILADNALRYEQLYREERAKNEALLGQKQTLANKITQLSEELERKWQLQEEIKSKDNSAELNRIKAQLAQLKTELEHEQSRVKSLKKQIEDKSKQPVQTKTNKSEYRITLQQNYTQEREKNKQLDAELQTLKVRLQRAVLQSQKVTSLEDALNAKNDELNDTKRKSIAQEKEIGVLQAQLKQTKSDLDNIKRENSALKLKLVDSGQQIRKNYELKQLQSKKNVQKISEELSIATSELREEKRAAVRLQNELASYKAQVQRLQTVIEQTKGKEQTLYEELQQLRNTNDSLTEECERLKSEIRYKSGVQDGLNEEIVSSQDKIYKLNQQNSELRLKTQAIQTEISEIRRELSSVKVLLPDIELYASSKVAANNWQEQRDRDNLSSFVQKVKKIVRTSEISQGSNDRPTLYTPTPNAVPDYHIASSLDYNPSFQPSSKYEAPAYETPSFNYRAEFSKYAALS